jgi:hypothetical protein
MNTEPKSSNGCQQSVAEAGAGTGTRSEMVECEVYQQELAEHLVRLVQKGPGGVWQFRCHNCAMEADVVGSIIIVPAEPDPDFANCYPPVGFSDVIRYVNGPAL